MNVKLIEHLVAILKGNLFRILIILLQQINLLIKIISKSKLTFDRLAIIVIYFSLTLHFYCFVSKTSWLSNSRPWVSCCK